MKLSFIVPVYNVEQYLRKCVDSLLAQDYDDYEIILVDDGSTDNSPQICDEYVRAFEIGDCKLEIKCIHQKNGGLSAARNAGLKVAKGEYVCFVDSDDYWQPNVLAGLMAQIERDNLDVLRFRYQNVREVMDEGMNGLMGERRYEVFQPYKRDARLGNDYSETVTDGVSFLNMRMNTQCYAVMFILRRDLIIGNQTSNIIHNTFEKDSCLFTEGIFFEDTDWTPRMLCRANRVASTDTIVYNYLVRQGSISRSVSREKQKKVLDDKMRLIESLQKQSKELQIQGKDNKWFCRMIADTVISIIGILSVQFYSEKRTYLDKLRQLEVFPIASKISKAKIINLSPRIAIELLHLKNRR